MLIACIRPAVPLNPTNVVETRTNQPYFNGLYNLFMVKLGMVYFCLTHIIPSMTITNQRIYQRKLGSNTSVLRTNRILRLEMMQGGRSHNNT